MTGAVINFDVHHFGGSNNFLQYDLKCKINIVEDYFKLVDISLKTLSVYVKPEIGK